MNFVDFPSTSRMSALSDLTRALQQASSPHEALVMYCAYLRDAHPDRAHLLLSTSGLKKEEYRIWRMMGDDGVEQLPLTDPWNRIGTRLYQGGIVSEAIREGISRWIRDIDWTTDPHFATTLGPYKSLIAVPLLNDGFPLTWSIMLSRDRNHFSVQDIEESATRGTLIASLLGSLHVSRQLANANAYIEAELRRMARIQRALLPDPIPEIPGIRLAASYETFGQVGGDIYDFIPLNGKSDQWCIFIGDASGHGPSAAVVAAMVQATLHHCAADSSGPAALFHVMNQRLCQKRIEGSFVTAFLGFYDVSKRQLNYASAGHPPPMVPAAPGSQTRFLNAVGGLPLGIDEQAIFEEIAIELRPSDKLLLYTDGISEARSPDGTMFGTEGIESSFYSGDGNAQDVIDRLRDSLASHQRGRQPDDDQTSVALYVDP